MSKYKIRNSQAEVRELTVINSRGTDGPIVPHRARRAREVVANCDYLTVRDRQCHEVTDIVRVFQVEYRVL